MTRAERFMPGGTPKYIKIYDNGGETIDRYTVVFTWLKIGRCVYVGMSGSPFNPQGFCQHGEHTERIDYPRYSHLGKKITFADLPIDCQKVVIEDYKEMWRIK